MAGDRCDRCGGKATHRANPPSRHDPRELFLCKKHIIEHGEALKAQKFVVTDLVSLDSEG